MKQECLDLINELRIEFSRIKEILIVILYGSYARGDYSVRHSDFDLFIILNKEEVSEKSKEEVNNKIIPIGIKYGIRIHNEFHGGEIKQEDKTLIEKVIEEGKVIFSSGLFIINDKKIGLKQFIIYNISAKEAKTKTRLSQILHGKKSWYYKGKKRITKEYKGIIDNDSIISLGKGTLMVVKDRQNDIEGLFKRLNVKYNIKRVIYA